MRLRPHLFSLQKSFYRRHIAMRPHQMARSRIEIPSEMVIELTDTEDQICTLLEDCTKHLKEKGIITSCRIAGGWVRDKVDSAAPHFAQSQGVKVGNIARILSNPDQSKHLESARITIFDTEIDLVNLRSEKYAENSRIPTEVAFGTPTEDAMRRDTTINALFYNVHSREVEDFTGKGLDDLRNGIIRTPLPPKDTFLDDPLRVIRCVRFASRFGFGLVPELEESAKDPIIQTALSKKVSRERVGEEFTKMLKGRDPLRSVELINSLSLYKSMFSVIPDEVTASFSTPPAPTITALTASIILDALLQSTPELPLTTVHPTLLAVAAEPSCKARLFFAATMTPYLGVTYLDRKKKEHLAVEAIIREGLKVGTQNHYLDGIPALFSAASVLKDPRLGDARFTDPSERVAIGLLLRNTVVHNPNTGSHWSSSMLFALLQELVPLYDSATSQLDIDAANLRIKLYNTFVNRIEELKLPASVDAKPILDGREVVRILDAGKPGAWTGQVLATVLQWQLDHPEGTKEECSVWLKAEQDRGAIILEAPREGEPASKRPRRQR